MKKILGLDISSSTIGWAIINVSNKDYEVNSYGYIKPPKKKVKKRELSLSERLSDTYDLISGLIAKHSPDDIVVERYANRFSSGRSTIRTIMMLSLFNEMVSLCVFREFGKNTYQYAPITIRSSIGKYFDKSIKSKDDAFKFVCENISKFNTKTNRMGNMRKESYDEADAICVALCHFIKKYI